MAGVSIEKLNELKSALKSLADLGLELKAFEPKHKPKGEGGGQFTGSGGSTGAGPEEPKTPATPHHVDQGVQHMQPVVGTGQTIDVPAPGAPAQDSPPSRPADYINFAPKGMVPDAVTTHPTREDAHAQAVNLDKQGVYAVVVPRTATENGQQVWRFNTVAFKPKPKAGAGASSGAAARAAARIAKRTSRPSPHAGMVRGIPRSGGPNAGAGQGIVRGAVPAPKSRWDAEHSYVAPKEQRPTYNPLTRDMENKPAKDAPAPKPSEQPAPVAAPEMSPQEMASVAAFKNLRNQGHRTHSTGKEAQTLASEAADQLNSIGTFGYSVYGTNYSSYDEKGNDTGHFAVVSTGAGESDSDLSRRARQLRERGWMATPIHNADIMGIVVST